MKNLSREELLELIQFYKNKSSELELSNLLLQLEIKKNNKEFELKLKQDLETANTKSFVALENLKTEYMNEKNRLTKELEKLKNTKSKK